MTNTWGKFKNTFIPKWFNRVFTGGLAYRNFSVNFLSSREPVLIDIDAGKAWEAYCTIPHLNVVINQKAKMISNMRLTLHDKEGNEVEDKFGYTEFLRKPNPLQSFKEWVSQYSIMYDLWGNAFVYPLVGSKLQDIPFALWNLPSAFMQINKTGKLFEQRKIEDIIESYELDMPEYNKKYKPHEVWHSNNNDSPDYFVGTSKLKPLRKNLTTIDAVLKTANVLYNERGGMFMFSQEGKGEMGAIPLSKDEKEEVERQYREEYGVHEGQKRYVITTAALKATPISFPINELMMPEQLESDFSTIIASYGMSRDLFPSTKGATFENQNQAQKATYQNTIQPEADDIADMLTALLKLNEKGLKFKANFDHLPVFQDEMKAKAMSFKAIADAISTMISIGYTREEAETLLELKK